MKAEELPRMTLREAQEYQAEHDEHCWEHKDTVFRYLDHIYKHVGKAQGAFAGYLEASDHIKGPELDLHKIGHEIVPRMLFSALQIANVCGVDAQDVYLALAEEIKRRLNCGEDLDG